MHYDLVAVLTAIFALLTVVLCAGGVIPPNRVIGLRATASLRSLSAWRTVHRKALVPLAVTNAAVVGCWLLYPAKVLGSNAVVGLGLAVLVAGLLWA